MKRIYPLLFLVAIMVGACGKDDIQLPELLSFSPERGGPGNLVYLRGRSFGEDSTGVVIDFNGKAAVIRKFDDTLVTVEVPEGATTGKIGYSLGGEKVSTAQDFIVLPGRWIRRKDIPFASYEARGLGIGTASGGLGYMGLGYNGGSTLKDFWSYDATSDSWTRLPDCGLDMQAAVQMVINGKIYVGLGQAFSQNQSFHKQFWEFDPATDKWTRKRDFPGDARTGAIGIAYGNKGYAGMGDGNTGSNLKDWWEYDPATDNWTRKADNPSQSLLQWPTGMLVENRVFVGTSAYVGSREWYEYLPASDTWVRRADFPGRIVFAPSTFVLGAHGYLMAGGDECWQYDPGTNRWTQYAFIRQILGGMAFAVNGRGFYIPGAGGGGSTNAPYLGKEVWEFIP